MTERERLMGHLSETPFLEPYPSHANFILCKACAGLVCVWRGAVWWGGYVVMVAVDGGTQCRVFLEREGVGWWSWGLKVCGKEGGEGVKCG